QERDEQIQQIVARNDGRDAQSDHDEQAPQPVASWPDGAARVNQPPEPASVRGRNQRGTGTSCTIVRIVDSLSMPAAAGPPSRAWRCSGGQSAAPANSLMSSGRR